MDHIATVTKVHWRGVVSRRRLRTITISEEVANDIKKFGHDPGNPDQRRGKLHKSTVVGLNMQLQHSGTTLEAVEEDVANERCIDDTTGREKV